MNGAREVSVDERHRVAEAILESAAEAIVYADRAGVIRLWNPGATRLFGYTEEEALGCSLDIIIPENLRARHWAGFHQTVKSGYSRYGTSDVLAVPAVRKDGTRLSLEFTVALTHDAGGEVDGMVALMRDVTGRFEELKALRRQLAGKPAT